MIVYLVGVIFILFGLYSAWTKKPRFISHKNADELLNAEKYGDYIQKVGIVYIGLGGIMIFVTVFSGLLELPFILHLIILLCLYIPLLNFYYSLNKRYFDPSISNAKDKKLE